MMAEAQKVTAVYRVTECSGSSRFVVVEITGQRCPQALAQRLNERPGMNRTIELAAVLACGGAPEDLGKFQPLELASTLEDAQTRALRGAWHSS